MSEKFTLKKTEDPSTPTEQQSDFIDTVLGDTDFKISDYEPASRETIHRSSRVTETVFVKDGVVDSILEGKAIDNAALIKRAGQPTVPGIEVVEPISKLNVNPDTLKITPTIEKNPNAEPVRLDQGLAPSAREEERARAREAAKKPWWKKMIGG